MEGREYPTLLDSGAQPSGISLELARKLGLKIYQLDTLLDIEGFGGNDVPYLGYVEAHLQVKGISGMDEDSLFLVVPDSNYTRRVPISLGTVHIERCLQLLKEGEITKLPISWERAIFPKHILKKDKIIDSDFNLESVDLTAINDWSQEDKKAVEELFQEYGRLFALDKNDLGHTTKVKHKIKLNDYTPFKERYRRVPPHLYEEVQKHLKEMVEIGAIRKSNSPWASAVVLVRKKDGSLRFCIDLRHLNNRTIKDAYSLPRIEETLDCLNGAKIFTSLDLKSGYWQVEMEEESKPLIAFMVGPLGFFECERMQFGLTNAPATFQRLMESCLGDLHLNWCVIYLDDIIVFSETPGEHVKRL